MLGMGSSWLNKGRKQCGDDDEYLLTILNSIRFYISRYSVGVVVMFMGADVEEFESRLSWHDAAEREIVVGWSFPVYITLNTHGHRP